MASVLTSRLQFVFHFDRFGLCNCMPVTRNDFLSVEVYWITSWFRFITIMIYCDFYRKMMILIFVISLCTIITDFENNYCIEKEPLQFRLAVVSSRQIFTRSKRIITCNMFTFLVLVKRTINWHLRVTISLP